MESVVIFLVCSLFASKVVTVSTDEKLKSWVPRFFDVMLIVLLLTYSTVAIYQALYISTQNLSLNC